MEAAPPGGGSIGRGREGVCAKLPWAGAGACAFGESRVFIALGNWQENCSIAGVGFARAEEVASSTDRPVLTTGGHSPPIFQAVFRNARLKLCNYSSERSVETDFAPTLQRFI